MRTKITHYLSYVLALFMLTAYVPLNAQHFDKAVVKESLVKRTPGNPANLEKSPQSVVLNKFGAYKKRTNDLQVPAPIKLLPKTNKSALKATKLQPIMKIKGGPQLWGVIEYSDAWESLPEEERPTGLYSFLASTPNTENPLLLTGTNGPNGGGVFYNDAFHYVNYIIMYESVIVTYTYNYDINTWQQNGYSQYGSDGNIIGTDLTYDAETGNVYGYFYNPLDNTEPMRFGTITYNDYGATVTNIAQEENDMICLAADNNGQLFAISSDGGFWKVNKTTGEKDLIDYTGVRPSTFRQSATFDRNTGKLYWTAFLEDFTSALYEVNPINGRATLISEIPDNMEISCLYIPDPEAEDNAPAAVTDFSVSFEGSSKEGIVEFTLPTETYGGETLSGIIDYKITANDIVVKQSKAQAGTKIHETISVENGFNELAVITTNTAGDSPISNKINKWVGYDIPESPTNVILEIDKESRKTVLSWKAPVGSLNGGFFDATTLKYNVVRYPGKIEVAHEIQETLFHEILPESELTAYYYEVTAINGDMASNPATSNKQAIGTAFEVPFIDDFSKGDTYGLYTIINANEDDKTWSESNNCFSYFFSWMNSADDWLITPPVKLKTGETYTFSFDIKGSSSYDIERYAVSFGRNTDPNSYQELIPSTELKSSNYVTVKKDINIESDGDYYFGIHALSDAYKGILSVTNIKILNGTKTSAPDSVTNLSIIPANQGELKAFIKFTAPTRFIDGSQLTNLNKIEVYREKDILISTIENPTPGQEYNCTDNNAINGYNHYTVYAYNDNGQGKAASDSTYVGQDIPMAPMNVKIKDNGTGTTLTWETPATTGIHGGYVDSSQLVYNIYDPEGNLIKEKNQNNSWSYTTDMEAQTGLIYYGVTAVSVAGESSLKTSNYLVTGKPHTLPFQESFAGGGTSNTFWWSYGSNPINAFSFAVDNASDHDMGSAYWFAINEDEYAYLNSGKITLSGSNHPMLFFDYYVNPGDDTTIKVNVECAGEEEKTLETLDIKTLKGNTTWRKATVIFDEQTIKAKYFVLKFYVQSKEWMSPIYIDNIEIRDVLKYDLKNQSTVLPPSVMSGDSIEIKTTIFNYGSEDAENFRLNLYANDQFVMGTELERLNFNADTIVILNYKPKLDVSSEVILTTSIDYSMDQNKDNNTSEAIEVNVLKPQYPTISDLSGSCSNGQITLTWSRPDIYDNNVEEGFESFTPWSTTGCNGWSVFDGDRSITNAYTAMWYPHIGEELSFIVFNKNYAIMDATQEPIFTAHSGDQCMAAFATVHDYTQDIPNDDWLITPELSGETQTISFWIKSLTDYKEDFYVYYSTEKADTSSLRKNLIAFEKWGIGSSWTQYEYELPAGAKYFGIRYTSNLSGILIDDFAYTGTPLVIKGYNIYRDNTLIDYVTANTTSYQIEIQDAEQHSYAVTVVYNTGESASSNVISLTTSISEIFQSDEIVDIYTIDGIKLPVTDINLLKTGIYIINGKKCLVK